MSRYGYSRIGLLTAGVAVVLVGWLVFSWLDPDSNPAGVVTGGKVSGDHGTKASSVDLDSAATPPSVGADAPAPAGVAVDTEGDGNRESLEGFPGGPLVGRILDEEGVGIPGATVTWTAWDDRFNEYALASLEIPAASIAARSVMTATDDSGAFAFDSAPGGADGNTSVVWASHNGFRAGARTFPSGTWTWSEDLVLTAADPVTVEVLMTGEAAGLAMVVQRLAFPRGSPAVYNGGKDLPKSDLLFLRSYDFVGATPLSISPLGREQVLVAVAEGMRSRPYRGPDHPRIKLDLFPSFRLEGTVIAPEGSLPQGVDDWTNGGWGRARVEVEALRGGVVFLVGSLPVREEGDFGPAVLPRLEGDRYRATLRGNLYIPRPKGFAVPEVNEEVSLQLQAQIGNKVWLKAEDTEGNPIPYPVARVRWVEDAETVEQVFRGRPDSYLVLAGLPAGRVEGTIWAEGYSSQGLGSILVPEVSGLARLYELAPVAPIEGVCLSDTGPLSDFELRYWSLYYPDTRVTLQVHGAEEGRFVIEHPMAGDLSLSAISPDFEVSQEVVLSEGDEANRTQVVLRVEPPGEMVGRLVDADTGAALPDGWVSIILSQALHPMDPIGPPIFVAADGSFRCERLPRGMTLAAFSAPGYSTRERKVWFDGREVVDLGDVQLSPTQPLRARLLLKEGEDPSAYVLLGKGVGSFEPAWFDAQGNLTVPQANGGLFRFEVIHSEVVGMQVPLLTKSAWLRAGEDWSLLFDLRGGRELVISVPPPEARRRPLLAKVKYTATDGYATTRVALIDEAGQCSIGGIAPGAVSIKIKEVNGLAIVGTRALEMPADGGGPLAVEIDLALRPLTLRVVDERGDPVPEVLVEMRSSQVPGLVLTYEVSNLEGLCHFKTVPPEVDTLSLFGPAAAMNHGIPFDPGFESDEIMEIVFQRDAAIDLLVTDDGVPQPSATIRLWSLGEGEALLPGRSPDADGRLTLPKLGPGSYELRLSGAGLWPHSMVVEAKRDGSFYSVPARRLGGLSLVFLGSQGEPLDGAPIRLEYVPTGEGVNDWIADGKLTAPGPNPLVTDEQGRILLEEIPHGSYRWSCGEGTGFIEVPIGGTRKDVVRIP